jgi:CheY-like chemotaxis protein
VRPGEPPGPPEPLSEHLYLFEVIDTGPGISPDAQKAIFEPFEQGEAGLLKGGTGLGLAIARRHVTLMGGELKLVSEAGRGSAFSFTLPLPEARLEDRWERVARLAPGLSVEALVVDDLPENREVLAEMLRQIGAVVRTAESGEGALKEAQARPPDIVFMDIRMPGMDGVEAMRRISQTCDRARVKIAAVSASALTHEREQYLGAGFDAFLDKPIRAGRLYACLADLLSVTYEYADSPQEVPPEGAETRVDLPEGLAERLRGAATLHRVTELRRCLEEVEALGAQGRGFAARLRALVEAYDMEGILRLLKEGEPDADRSR